MTNKVVVSSSFLRRKEYICYKQKLLDDNGWCYTHNTWGFCGSSCKLMQVERTEPLIYHKMVWVFPFKHPSRCGTPVNDYYLCISSILPRTSVFRFKRDGKGKLKFMDARKENIEDSFDATNKNTKENLGYQIPCKECHA